MWYSPTATLPLWDACESTATSFTAASAEIVHSVCEIRVAVSSDDPGQLLGLKAKRPTAVVKPPVFDPAMPTASAATSWRLDRVDRSSRMPVGPEAEIRSV